MAGSRGLRTETSGYIKRGESLDKLKEVSVFHEGICSIELVIFLQPHLIISSHL
jgi:hypothetical protein